jgi:Uma2 family endonuclease
MKPVKHQPQQSFTYADYCGWSEDERWELIDGEAYDMSPAPTRHHQELVGEIFRQIANFLEGRPCKVYVAPFDVRLPAGDEADAEVKTVIQPDISVICDPAKLDDAGCRGAPDWIVEVLSPGTAAKDQIRKRELYERHGVREYWLVHPTDRILTRYLREGERFGPARLDELQESATVGIFPELAVSWAFLAETD